MQAHFILSHTLSKASVVCKLHTHTQVRLSCLRITPEDFKHTQTWPEHGGTKQMFSAPSSCCGELWRSWTSLCISVTYSLHTVGETANSVAKNCSKASKIYSETRSESVWWLNMINILACRHFTLHTVLVCVFVAAPWVKEESLSCS